MYTIINRILYACIRTIYIIYSNIIQHITLHLGKLYRILSQEENALESYTEALEICPENADLLTTIGLLYLKLGITCVIYILYYSFCMYICCIL